MHPEWQELRDAWGINYTGGTKDKTDGGWPMLRCPSEAARPLETIERWPGNRAYKACTTCNDQKTITVGHPFEGEQPCPDCNQDAVACKKCNGSGQVSRGGGWAGYPDEDCPECWGRGYLTPIGTVTHAPTTAEPWLEAKLTEDETPVMIEQDGSVRPLTSLEEGEDLVQKIRALYKESQRLLTDLRKKDAER
jgi:hypothetical protein